MHISPYRTEILLRQERFCLHLSTAVIAFLADLVSRKLYNSTIMMYKQDAARLHSRSNSALTRFYPGLQDQLITMTVELAHDMNLVRS